jgi:hypothetical protein
LHRERAGHWCSNFAIRRPNHFNTLSSIPHLMLKILSFFCKGLHTLHDKSRK